MKKFLVIILTLLVFGVGPVFAQSSSTQSSIESQLNLTQEQQKQLQDISAKMEAELAPYIQDLSSHVQMLTTLSNGGSVTPEQVAAIKNEFARNQSNLSGIQKKYENQVFQILTPAQKNIYNQMKKDLRHQLDAELNKQP